MFTSVTWIRLVSKVTIKETKVPSLLIKDFPAKLHRMIKVQAAVEGISLKNLVIKALREYLKRVGVSGLTIKEVKEG